MKITNNMNITKQEFETQINQMYYQMLQGEGIEDLLIDCGKTKLQQLNQYITDNYQSLNLIHIDSCIFYKGKIILKTDIGQFLLDIPVHLTDVQIHLLENKDINILTFYGIVSNNNLEYSLPTYEKTIKIRKNYYGREYVFSNNIIKDYLKAYFHYRMIADPKLQKQLFIQFNKDNLSLNDKSIPLECLKHPDYNSFAKTNEKYAEELRRIYNYYYQFDQNIELVFTFIIFTHDLKMSNYIKEHFDQFKDFIINQAKETRGNNKYTKMIYQYLIDTGIKSLFSEEEFKKIYQINVYYWTQDREFFTKIAKSIENTSPMIRLRRNDETMVHISYRDYDLFEEKPVKLLDYNINQMSDADFLKCFLKYNQVIAKLYQIYYPSYQKAISSTPEKDNLYDFIRCMLKPKQLKRIYEGSKYNMGELNALMHFSEFYGLDIQKGMQQVEEQHRKRSLTIHNMIVENQENKKAIDVILSRLGLNSSTIYSFVIHNKSLFSLEKEGFLEILNYHYRDSIRLLDILSLIDEGVTREMTDYELLSERRIPLKVFNTLYQFVSQRNPVMMNMDFRNWDEKKRKRYLNLLKLGYYVLESPISSVEEYQQKFPKALDIFDLISQLEGTDLSQRLLEKVSLWPDFQEEDKKSKKLVPSDNK